MIARLHFGRLDLLGQSSGEQVPIVAPVKPAPQPEKATQEPPKDRPRCAPPMCGSRSPHADRSSCAYM